MRLSEIGISVLAHVFGFYMAMGTLLVLFGGVYLYGPSLETLVSPIVGFAPVDGITRDADKVCFDLHIVKLHAAVPIIYTFFVEAHLSERMLVAAYLADQYNHKLAKKDSDLITHAVGEHWTRHYCFELPQTVQDLDIRVGGEARHRRHPFYDTPTPIPPFNVPALTN